MVHKFEGYKSIIIFNFATVIGIYTNIEARIPLIFVESNINGGTLEVLTSNNLSFIKRRGFISFGFYRKNRNRDSHFLSPCILIVRY